MKKLLSTISAILILATLAGCNRKTSLSGEPSETFSQSTPDNSTPAEISEDIQLQKISELRGDLDRQIEAIRNADYDNLHALDNFTVTIPETDVLYELELTKREYTWQEYYDKFYRIFEANFGDIYTEEEMARSCSALAQEDEWSDVNGYGEIATLAERREKFDSGELTFKWLEFSTDKAYLEIGTSTGGGIYRMYHDGIKTRSNFDGDPEDYPDLSCIHVERLFKAVKETFEVNSDDRYELLDTEVSVNDAAAEVTRIVKEYGYTWGGDLEPGIYEYRVFDLNDGKYGLEFEFAPFYKGVMLDCGDVTYETYTYGMPIDLYKLNHDYYILPAHALMIESGKLESFKYGDGAYNAAELAEYDSVIPLDKAVEIAAEKFGAGMKLSLGSAELCYSEMYSKNEDYTVRGAFPVWKLKLANSMDGWKYITYINATTGEMEYYLTEKWVL